VKKILIILLLLQAPTYSQNLDKVYFAGGCFWCMEESFEKTDIFIEKSINTSFELLENKFLKNAFDLGKFVYKETFQKKAQ
jgi:deferrochelatase/peroxidase EfeB